MWPFLTVDSAGQSRQFAFAQFAGIPEARRFLDKYYPYVSLYGAYDPSRTKDMGATKVRIAFSRDKDDRDKPGKSEDDWKCEVVCFTSRLHSVRLTNDGKVLTFELLPSNVMFPLPCTKNS
jgi:hypothetical protein